MFLCKICIPAHRVPKIPGTREHGNAKPGTHTHLCWPSYPPVCFRIVEAQFQICEVESQEDCFTLVASVLPKFSAHRVCRRLTEIQKAKLLFNMDDMDRKCPIDLLNKMVELVKPSEDKTQLFAMLFICCLPPQVHIQLTEDDYTDLCHCVPLLRRLIAALLCWLEKPAPWPALSCRMKMIVRSHLLLSPLSTAVVALSVVARKLDSGSRKSSSTRSSPNPILQWMLHAWPLAFATCASSLEPRPAAG